MIRKKLQKIYHKQQISKKPTNVTIFKNISTSLVRIYIISQTTGDCQCNILQQLDTVPDAQPNVKDVVKRKSAIT